MMPSLSGSKVDRPFLMTWTALDEVRTLLTLMGMLVLYIETSLLTSNWSLTPTWLPSKTILALSDKPSMFLIMLSEDATGNELRYL